MREEGRAMTHFLVSEGLVVGVVLAAGERAPEQERELAGGRDDGFAATATVAVLHAYDRAHACAGR